MKTKFIPVVIFFFLSATVCLAQDNKDIITENDIKQIESGNTNSSYIAVFKIKNIYEEKGKDAIIPAVPALINRTLNEVRNPDVITESRGQLILNLIRVLSVTGDERVKPVLLELMADKKVMSKNIARGFLNLGKSVIPDIVDSLDSNDELTKRKAAFYLGNMYELDETGEFFSDDYKTLIRNKLLDLIKGNYDSDEIILPLSALGYFGDETTIPVFEEIINNSSTASQAIENKGFAQKALDTLKINLKDEK